MRIVILEKHNKKVVEYEEDVFLKLLKLYYDEYGDVEKAFAGVKKELVKSLLKT